MRAGIYIGIGTILILIGLFAGHFANNHNSKELEVLFPQVISNVDNNISNIIDKSFGQSENKVLSDKDFLSGAKYFTKGIVYDLGSYLYFGKWLDKQVPWVYDWVKANMALCFVLFLILFCPDVIGIIVLIILALILWGIEKYKKRRDKKNVLSNGERKKHD